MGPATAIKTGFATSFQLSNCDVTRLLGGLLTTCKVGVLALCLSPIPKPSSANQQEQVISDLLDACVGATNTRLTLEALDAQGSFERIEAPVSNATAVLFSAAATVMFLSPGNVMTNYAQLPDRGSYAERYRLYRTEIVATTEEVGGNFKRQFVGGHITVMKDFSIEALGVGCSAAIREESPTELVKTFEQRFGEHPARSTYGPDWPLLSWHVCDGEKPTFVELVLPDASSQEELLDPAEPHLLPNAYFAISNPEYPSTDFPCNEVPS
ncbi:hypothetical protein QTO30_10095 [Yoonia sp. GPGPB17]|uniref:hypothetical protein n=1 Tax=Yoonia sp. GPGPB17 TaxID=3026147 RepID=UPI0030BFC49C